MATAGATTGLLRAAAAAIAAEAARPPIAAALLAAEEHVAAAEKCAVAAQFAAVRYLVVVVVQLETTEQPVKARRDPPHREQQVMRQPPARRAAVDTHQVEADTPLAGVHMPAVVVMRAADTNNPSRSTFDGGTKAAEPTSSAAFAFEHAVKVPRKGLYRNQDACAARPMGFSAKPTNSAVFLSNWYGPLSMAETPSAPGQERQLAPLCRVRIRGYGLWQAHRSSILR
jgi:hypothetical protein